MNFLPYQKLEFKSLLTKDEAILKLAKKIDPNPPFLNWKFGKLEEPFKGSLDGNKFMLTKVVRNSAGGLPCIEGRIKEDEKGCTIYVTLKLRWYHLLMISFIYAVIIIFFLVLFLTTPAPLLAAMTMPAVIILFSYTVGTLVFKFHASFLEDELKEIFEVKDEI